MASDDGFALERRLARRTTTYLDDLDACVSLLPELVAHYADDGEYERIAERICDYESECDRTHRHLSTLLSDATVDDAVLESVHVHLHSGQIIRLYRVLDDVANAAEQFAEELVAIEPRRIEVCLDLLEAMAERIADAVTPLRQTISAYAEVLVEPDQSIAIAEPLRRVREAESDCDGLRNDLVETAFESDGSTIAPLTYRELALLMDDVADAMEDVTDHLVFLVGNQLWIDVDAGRSPVADGPAPRS